MEKKVDKESLDDLSRVALEASKEVNGLATVEVRDGTRCVKLGIRIPVEFRNGVLSLIEVAQRYLNKD